MAELYRKVELTDDDWGEGWAIEYLRDEQAERDAALGAAVRYEACAEYELTPTVLRVAANRLDANGEQYAAAILRIIGVMLEKEA